MASWASLIPNSFRRSTSRDVPLVAITGFRFFFFAVILATQFFFGRPSVVGNGGVERFFLGGRLRVRGFLSGASNKAVISFTFCRRMDVLPFRPNRTGEIEAIRRNRGHSH